jgi:hypothetical protein
MASASDVGKQVATTLNGMSRALVTSKKAALRDVGKLAKKELETAGRSRVPSLKFRNMGGAKLGVKTKVTADEVTVSPSGPWGILEPGAKRHTIGRKGRRIRVGDGWRYGPVKHPGTRDTKAWTRGQDATFEKVEKTMTDVVGEAVEEAFGG